MRASFLFRVVFFLIVSLGSLVAEPPAVEVIVDTEALQPTTTFEVRFAKPMISQDEVGSAPDPSPLVIEPPIAGAFTWLSTRSGVFVPEEMPRLGTEYVLTLRDGLEAADGSAIGAGFRQAISAPAFGITQQRNGVYDAESIPVEPEVKLAFNLGIDLAGAESHFAFVNSEGRRVPAKVRYATNEDYFPIRAIDDDWAKRWREAQDPSPARDSVDPDVPREETFTNRLVVTADAPLSPGGTWSLEIASGLKSEAGDYSLGEPVTIALGAVAAFDFEAVTPTNFINTGPSVTLEFTQPLAPDIVAETASQFFSVKPEVKNLRFEEGWSSLVVRGDFELGKDYTLVVSSEVVSAQGLPFSGERERAFSFQPVAPRLYLPEITGHQMEFGARRFEVLSVNLKSLRFVARLVKPEDVPAAIEAFAGYDRPWEQDGPENEPYRPLPDDAIPGEVVAERTLELIDATVDARQETALDWTEILGGQKAGVVFLTVEGEPMDGIGGTSKPGAQALMQITDLGVLWKKTGGRLRVNVFSMKTGNAVANATAALLDEARAEIAGATTSATGVAEFDWKDGGEWLVVRNGADTHAVRLGSGAVELPMGAFGIPIHYRGWNSPPSEDQPHRALLFTDRPLYRPGETVRIKGIVRRVGGGGLEIVKNRTARLKILDPRWRDVDEQEIRTDDRGSFDAAVDVGGAAPGRYSLVLDLGRDGSFHESFLVADFQPNAFELDVALPGRLAPGQAVDAKVTAKYLFGAPLGEADAKWTLRVARAVFAPECFDAFVFGYDTGADGNVLTLRGEERFDGAAGFRIAPELPRSVGAPSRGVLTVEATDINQQTVTDTQTFLRDASDFYLGISLAGGSVLRAGEPVTVRAVAVRPDGEPLAKPVKVKAELVLRKFDTVRVKGAGNAISFRTETSDETVATAHGETLIPSREGLDWVVREGGTAALTPPKAGQYRVRISTTDAGGNEVLSEYALYVAGADAVVWDYRNPAQVDLVPDKPDYRPGDTARVLVKTPIEGDALVTVERGERVWRSFTAKLEGNAPVIEVPIEKGDGPNVFVSMVVIRGADASKRKHPMPEYRYGVCQLGVRDPLTKLAVEVNPARAEVEPGQDMEVTLAVNDADGEPVADASVTFFAIDDGIVSLTGYERPHPDRIFDAPIPLAVRTGLTLFQLMPEDPADLEFGNKGYLIGGGGADGPGLKIRENFPGTACWFPTLRTGKDGNVSVKFAAPDAITRYRLVAVAQAKANQFGSAESAFAIRQPLMLMPALGQFANVGDRLIARAVVRNDTGADGVATVTLKTDDKVEIDGAATTRVSVKNGTSAAVDFPVTFRERGKAHWTWSATLESFRDDVVSTIEVGTPMLALRETVLTDLGAKTNNLLAGVNPQLLEGTGSAEVTVSNTRLSSLRASVEYLRDYEFRCAEQTSSRLAPAIAMPALEAFVGEEVAMPESEVRAAIERIFSMQTESGGIAFWPDGREPSAFASAYAAVILARLHPNGADWPAGMEALLEFLSTSLRGTEDQRSELSAGDRALVLYALALAGRQEPAYNEALYQSRADLSRESRALLALAILHSGGSGDVVDKLLDPKSEAPDDVSWFGSASRDRAIQLLAWVRRDPKSPEVARLVKELLGMRVQGRWATTQDNAWALLALAEYAAAVEKPGATVKGAILVDAERTNFEVSRKSPTRSVTVALDAAQPIETIEVTNPGQAPLFGESRFVVHPPVGEQPRQDRGYAVSRNYRKIADDGRLVDTRDLEVGDRVLVTLRVESARAGHFVAIDDPLPAILEAVNPEFKSAAVGGVKDPVTRSDHQEMRADRVLYFCDRLPAGAHTFQYLARVRTAGDAMAGAAKVEEMYRPERFGLSETSRISSRELAR